MLKQEVIAMRDEAQKHATTDNSLAKGMLLMANLVLAIIEREELEEERKLREQTRIKTERHATIVMHGYDQKERS